MEYKLYVLWNYLSIFRVKSYATSTKEKTNMISFKSMTLGLIVVKNVAARKPPDGRISGIEPSSVVTDLVSQQNAEI
jgi:hypothetical protein